MQNSITLRGVPHFDQEKFTLLLGISDPTNSEMHKSLAEFAARNGFQKKEEFHMTVIGFKKAALIQNKMGGLPHEEREIMRQSILSVPPPSEIRLLPLFYKIAKEYVFKQGRERRETIIQMAEVDSLYNFYEKINAVTGLSLEVPPAHITLYTKGDGRGSAMGIGIDSAKDFEELHPEKIEIL